MKLKYLKIALLLTLSVSVNAQSVTPVAQSHHAGIRGLSVLNDKVAWMSGTQGSVAISIDGGKNWAWRQIKGFEKADFRDIEAFSDKEAVIMSSGTPALILKTIDGGLNWQLKYRNDDKAYFLDAMGFANADQGYILGDPINNKFLLLETNDAGETWHEAPNAPAALKDEAAFAASGTCIVVDKAIQIVTGGAHSRLLTSPVKKISWAEKVLPLTNGNASSGAFSFAHGKHEDIITGGDYANNKKIDSTIFILPAGNSVINKNTPSKGPEGFQSCIIYTGESTFISTGTPGSHITTDGGNTWLKIGNTSYNVCQKAKHGKLIIFAGDNGNTGIFKP